MKPVKSVKSTHISQPLSARCRRFVLLVLTATVALTSTNSISYAAAPSHIASAQSDSNFKQGKQLEHQGDQKVERTNKKIHPKEKLMARNYPEAIDDWKKYVTDHAYALKSIQPEKRVNGAIPESNFEDLNMLIPLLADKRIVYLGESSHGAAEFNSVKTRLIQYLHQQLGYNFIAFESGLPDAAIAQGTMKSKTAEETMKRSIFQVWWTEETLPLFQYMKDTQDSQQPLRLLGFDIQLQTPLLKDAQWLKEEKLQEQVMKAESDLAKWSRGKDLTGYRKAKPELLHLYKKLLEQVTAHEDELKKQYPNEPKMVLLMERAVEDRIRLINEYVEININVNIDIEKEGVAAMYRATEWRDRAMANNLIWLATEVYPEEKFIVWAHNGHISKAQSQIVDGSHKWMGELMTDNLQRQSYVMGLYMASGESAENQTRKPVPVQPLLPGSMEDILSSSKQPYTFMDLRYRDNERGNSWMFERVVSYVWGNGASLIVPRHHYDGVLLIDKVKLPRYIQ
ncbi:erythromycin esterase family protein [Paenibacillus arenosi]|uniref:Erythromycin esterase family protein n=1 Tax=Paenibacillus arenosi TaxID=2774142 RepID=A0ABR9B2Z6_9BACL|nr:erythromycin esterase family protein [Paenibacillus arenosi]MBD8500730.1 erythromycin esterase family protein [Paenibacillus arenosi]